MTLKVISMTEEDGEGPDKEGGVRRETAMDMCVCECECVCTCIYVCV